MSENTAAPGATTAGKPVRRGPSWVFLAVAIFFGLFYAWDVWAAIGNLVGLNLNAQGLDTQLSGFGWGVLVAGVLLPIAVFALAARLGRPRGLLAQAMLFLTGLGLVSALSIDIFLFGLGSLIV